MTSVDIALKLGIKPRTANFHFGNIVDKLGVLNRKEAIAMGIARGLIRTESRRPWAARRPIDWQHASRLSAIARAGLSRSARRPSCATKRASSGGSGDSTVTASPRHRMR